MCHCPKLKFSIASRDNNLFLIAIGDKFPQKIGAILGGGYSANNYLEEQNAVTNTTTAHTQEHPWRTSADEGFRGTAHGLYKEIWIKRILTGLNPFWSLDKDFWW